MPPRGNDSLAGAAGNNAIENSPTRSSKLAIVDPSTGREVDLTTPVKRTRRISWSSDTSDEGDDLDSNLLAGRACALLLPGVRNVPRHLFPTGATEPGAILSQAVRRSHNLDAGSLVMIHNEEADSWMPIELSPTL